MSKTKFNSDFKRDAVRGYPVREVSKRLGVSTHSLYIWVKKYSKTSEGDGNDDHAAENRWLNGSWHVSRRSETY